MCHLHVSISFSTCFEEKLIFEYNRIAFCACYAANTWNAQTFPFLSQLLYYENGEGS